MLRRLNPSHPEYVTALVAQIDELERALGGVWEGTDDWRRLLRALRYRERRLREFAAASDREREQ